MSHYTAARDFYSACFIALQRVLRHCMMVFSYAGSYCFRLSALHLHCALKHLHPFNLQRNSFALLHFSQGLMCRVITIVDLPCTQGPNRFIPSLRCNIIHQFLSVALPMILCSSDTSGITVSHYAQQ